MKHLILFFLILYLPLAALYAQEEKRVLGVTPFSSSGDRDARFFANSLTEIVVDAVFSTQRFRVVDRTNFDDLFTEENLQKGESFLDGLVVDQGKKLGAEFLLTGNLISVHTEPVYREREIKERRRGREISTTRNEIVGYRGRINFSLKLTEVETGIIKASEAIRQDAGRFLIFEPFYASEKEAMTQAIRNSRSSIARFIDKYFPVRMRILEIASQKKGYAREIVVTGGRKKGLQTGQVLRIIRLQKVTLDGSIVERQKTIGWATIERVEDDHFSVCKVKKVYGDDVLQAYNSAPDQVYLVSGN